MSDTPAFSAPTYSDIEPQDIDWLWPGMIPLGKVTLLAGSKGTGKTTLALEIAARVTRGQCLPGGNETAEGEVMFWSDEDATHDTLRPRFEEAGGDLSRIRDLREGTVPTEFGRAPFNPKDPKHLQWLGEEIRRSNVKLIVFDPVRVLLPMDNNRDQLVREALQVFIELATKFNVAVLAITHYGKGKEGRDGLSRVLGSSAITALARSVLAISTLPSPPEGFDRAVFRVGGNFAVNRGGYSFTLDQDSEAGVGHRQRIRWGGEHTLSIEEVFEAKEAERNEPGGNKYAVVRRLLGILAQGPKTAADVLQALDGHPEATVQRWATHIGIEKRRDSQAGRSVWSLPGDTRPLTDQIG